MTIHLPHVVECPICLKTNYGPLSPWIELHRLNDIAHLFHQHCIYPWMQENNTCPICRYKLTTLEFNELIRIMQITEKGKQVYIAACKTDTKALQVLLLNGDPISEEYRGEAVFSAFGPTEKQSELMELLLKDGAKIPEEITAKVLEDAASYGLNDIIRLLLSNNSTIPEEAKTIAAKNAAYNGHLDSLALLVGDGNDLTECNRGTIVCSAAFGGHRDIVKSLLENKTISQEARKEAIIEGICYPDIVELLWNNEVMFSGSQRGLLLMKAAGVGNINVVRRLLESQQAFPKCYQALAISMTIFRSHEDVLQLLKDIPQDDAQINDEIGVTELGKKVVLMVMHGHLKALKPLLESGIKISEPHLRKAMGYAYSKDRQAVLALLLKYHDLH